MPESSAHSDTGRPAPARGVVPLWRIAFGLLGAPAAWSVQLAATSALGGLACLGAASTRLAPSPAWTVPALLAINVVAVLLAAAALGVAYLDFRRTRREEHRRSAGLREARKGRTRFLSVAGIWIGILFLTATLASTISLVWRGACP